MYTKLYAVRRNMNVTQGELAKLANVSQSQISKIEKGSVKTPSHDKLVRISEAFGIPITDFMDHPVEPVQTPFSALTQAAVGAVIPLYNQGQEVNEISTNGDGFIIRPDRGIISQIKKPSFLDYSSEAYAAINHGSAMHPRYRPGDILFIDPKLEAIVGDDVALIFENQSGLFGMFREIVSIDVETIIVKDVETNTTQAFSISDLFGIHIVVGSQRNRT